MAEHEQLATKKNSVSSLPQVEREENAGHSSHQVDPIANVGMRATDARAGEAHAAMLNRSWHRSAQPQRSLLQLQRTHGNRYVQRVLALARKADGQGKVAPDVEAAIEQARGSGQALDATVRRKMESAFGASFDGVRIHTDARADHLNRAVNALAFTTGSDIFFRNGLYQPSTSTGQELLAHELTHVVQQNGSSMISRLPYVSSIQRMCSACEEEERRVQRKMTIGQAGDKYEQEADLVAKAVMNSLGGEVTDRGAREIEGVAISGASSQSVARQSDDDDDDLDQQSSEQSASDLSQTAEYTTESDTSSATVADSDLGTSALTAGGEFDTECSSLTYRQCTTGVYKCGYGGSGTCAWTGITGKCKCLGSAKRPLEAPAILPSWLVALLSAAALALLIACIATGVCEAGAIIAAAGAATAAIIIGILRAAGIEVRGNTGA